MPSGTTDFSYEAKEQYRSLVNEEQLKPYSLCQQDGQTNPC